MLTHQYKQTLKEILERLDALESPNISALETSIKELQLRVNELTQSHEKLEARLNKVYHP